MKKLLASRWTLIISIAIAGFAFGFFGWIELFEKANKTVSLSWVFSLTVGLFTRQLFIPILANLLNLAEYEIPWTLSLARILAPTATLSVAFVLVLSIVRRLSVLLKVKMFFRNHTIICGYSDLTEMIIERLVDRKLERTEFSLSRKLRGKILVLTKNLSEDQLRMKSSKSVVFMSADYERAEILRSVNLHRAQRVVIIARDDFSSTNTLTSIEKVCSHKRPVKHLEIWMHIEDSDLLQTFKEYKGESGDLNLSIYPFNTYQKMANRIVDKYSPDKYVSLKYDGDPAAHIGLFGLSSLGKYIVLEIAQMYHFANRKRPVLTVFEEQADARILEILQKWPGIENILDIRPFDIRDLTSLKNIEILADMSVVFFSWNKETEIYNLITKIRQVFYLLNTIENSVSKQFHPVVVLPIISKLRLVDCLGTSELFTQNWKALDLIIEQQQDFLTLESEEDYERIAKAISEFYLKQNNAKSPKWFEMTDYWKDENRYAAKHLLGIKLRYLGLEIAEKEDPRQEFDITRIPQTKELILSEVEHLRWFARKTIVGYAYGYSPYTVRDIVKIHRSLVPYKDLEKQEREKDSTTLKFMRDILAVADKKVVKSLEKQSEDNQ